MTVFLSVLLGIIVAVVIVFLMVFSYVLGYRNCARAALKEMDELEKLNG